MTEQKSIWVYIEHTGGRIADVSLELTGRARELADPLGFEVVGLGRLELPTSRLSSARSNQLSYKPGPGVSDQKSVPDY